MKIVAKSKHIRLTPRKLKLVVDTIKDLSIDETLIRLKFLPKKAAQPITQVLNQAISNATNNFNLNKEDLKIKKIMVQKGPSMKRWRAGARGRAKPYTRRTSHLTIILEKIKKEEVSKQKEK
jgi:large subunit ribosomal protein L22